MKGITTILVSILLLATATLNAQETKRQTRLEHLTANLNLTDSQIEEVKGVLENTREESKALKDNQELAPEERKKALQATKDANDLQIQNLLNEEQLSKYNEMKAPKAGKKGAKRQDLKEELGLTEMQWKKFNAINKTARAKKNTLKSDTSLSEEERKHKLKAVKTDTEAQVKRLLTKEQYVKMKSLKSERKGKKPMKQ